MLEQRFAFGQFLLNPNNGTLLRQGEPVAIGRRGTLLLETLLKRQGEILTKSELMDAAWPGQAVEESNLSVQIALLRKALGPSPDGGEWITTIQRIGYRFLGSSPEPKSETAQRPTKPFLAVLPFASLSSDPEQEFFADGLAEDIITMLSKLAGLIVIARSSSCIYKGKSPDIRQVARDLGVRFVMTGSVRRSGNRLRIAAQLSDGETGAQLWAESYAREIADVFEVQEELARKIVGELRIKLSPTEAAQWPGIVSTGTTNADAYNCFLRGRAIQRGATQNADVFKRTRELFQQAIEHDPAYAAPHAALGMAFAHDHANRWSQDPESSLAEARRLVDESIKRDPADPFSHGVAALVSMYEKDLERWAAEVDASLSLNPNFAPALSLRGILNTRLGKPLAAIEDIEQAMRLDPLFNHLYLHHLGVAHILSGKYETGAALLKERILLVPDTDVSRAYLAAVFGILGKFEEARQVWNDLMELNPNYSFGERVGGINPSDLKRIAEGLERAGLPVPK